MAPLNYHHLRYFHAVARTGSLTRAAKALRVAQSAVSSQIKSLEDSLGVELFERRGRSLALTEAGRLVLDYATEIFRAGEEMLDALRHRPSNRPVIRVGAAATLSRNFAMMLLKPVLQSAELVVHTGPVRELIVQLRAHTLDVVLSNAPAPTDSDSRLHSYLIDEQDVCVVSDPAEGRSRLKFPGGLEGRRIVLPSLESDYRAVFDAMLSRGGVRPVVAAECDDMPMLRLLAREAGALALVPRVVVRDELRARTLVERCRIPGLKESFYAIAPDRHFPNPLVRELLKRPQTAGKAEGAGGRRSHLK